MEPFWSLCDQAMEKGLKALLLSKQTSSHPPVMSRDVCELASFTDNNDLVTAARQLHSVVGTTPRMRYPDFLPSPKTPRDIYTLEMALNAYGIVEESLQLVRQSVQAPLDSSFN